MNTQILEEIGLTPGEIKVYLALVGLGETSTGLIVQESKVSISKVYTILDRLARKGLVSHIVRGNVKHFKAADPALLLTYLKEKEEKLRLQEKELQLIIPALQLKQNSSVTEETAQVYDGLRGIQAARERTLNIMKKGDEMWIIGIARTPYDRLTTYFHDYHRRRVKKGIRCNYLYNEYSRKPFGENSAAFPLSQVKYLPVGMLTHAWMEIYADTVTIGINFKKSFSVVIQNQDVADSFRNYAKILWQAGRK